MPIIDEVASDAARAASRFARGMAGEPYVFGGDTPAEGFDCSGLCEWAYGHAGVEIPRSSEAQFAAGFHVVEKGSFAVGDLIFSQWPGDEASPGHVVMYIGAGKVIAAPHTGTTVQVQDVGLFTDSHWVGARRPVPHHGETWEVHRGTGQLLAKTAHPGKWAEDHARSFRAYNEVTFTRV